MKTLKRFLFVATLAVVLISCGGLHFSAQSYQNDNNIKNTAIALIQKSNESYSSHATEVEKLKSDVMSAYEFEKTRKGNQATVAMWSEVINAKGNLFDLLNDWKTNDKLSTMMASEASIKIERLLNAIVDLENHKKK